MRIISTIAELRETVRDWRLARESIAFVPTMGNLHAGHASLVGAAHLHGRDLEVVAEALHTWHWWVRSPHGEVLAEGRTSDRQRAEEAAEDEATAVHPPTSELLERLLS